MEYCDLTMASLQFPSDRSRVALLRDCQPCSYPSRLAKYMCVLLVWRNFRSLESY